VEAVEEAAVEPVEGEVAGVARVAEVGPVVEAAGVVVEEEEEEAEEAAAAEVAAAGRRRCRPRRGRTSQAGRT
jgi:hypothetical protein